MRTRRKMKYGVKLLIVMAVYALLFLGLALFGLSRFWDYMAAYENSRPQKAIDAYMASLDIRHVQDGSGDLIAGVDSRLQSEEACREMIADALRGGITCARKLSECTDTKMVYMLLSGGKTIGKVTLEPLAADRYGFTPWAVSGDSFDLSFLMGQEVTVTVPYDHSVTVGGIPLTGDYITESGIPYPYLKDYYAHYAPPYMVTYRVPALLGTSEIQIADAMGNPVSAGEAGEESHGLNNCTQAQAAALEEITRDFVDSYVAFTSCANDDRTGNYQRLIAYMVPGGTLAQRMYDALGGLKWVSDRNARILSVDINRQVRFLDGRYLCDVTYVVSAREQAGMAETTQNLRILFVDTEDGLRAESMISY